MKPQLSLPGGFYHASKVGAEYQVDIFGEPQKQLDFTIFIQYLQFNPAVGYVCTDGLFTVISLKSCLIFSKTNKTYLKLSSSAVNIIVRQGERLK